MEIKMDDILNLSDRVEIAVSIGESYYREFKSALEGRPENKQPRELSEIKYDIAKTLVAFANADGGELFVGIEDDLTVTGVPVDDEKMEALLKSPRTSVMADTPLPMKQATIVNYSGKKVLYFSVSKGIDFVYLTSKGECFQRKDIESVPTSFEKINFDRNEKVSMTYDREFIDLAEITDLDHDLIARVGEQISKPISAEKLLQYLDLAEFDGTRLKLRKAALLLFAKKSNKWHPRLQVRILKIRGVEEKTGQEFNVTEVGESNGNIFQLIENSWDQLRPHLSDTKFSEDARFKNQILYPELACREALINAITHRDYNNEGRGIEVKIFDNRLEIENPGELLSSITIKDLESLSGVHQSRNTYIARVLREAGHIRELGEGIRRIFNLMKDNDMVPPKIESINKKFSLTLYYKQVYTPEEQKWLSNFEDYNLTRDQKTVVRLGLNGRPFSAKDVFENIGIVDEKDYRELISSLQQINILSNIYSAKELRKIGRKYSSRNKIPKYEIKIPNTSDLSNYLDKSDDRSDYARIYVGNLPLDVKEIEIRKALSKFGDIIKVVIPNLNKSRIKEYKKRYCFVEFDKRISANNALNSSSEISIKGSILVFAEATTRHNS